MGQLQHQNKEAGLVSILTVLFFMIFVSLIVVGFMAIVADDNRQTTDNDLSQNALSAARSGVEEGKRILLYCAQQPTPTGCTDAVLNSTDCDIFTTGDGTAIATALSIPFVGASGEVSVGANEAYQQYFTCLTLTRDTPSISSTVSEEYEYVVKLKTVGAYDSLKVTWSKDSGSYGFPSTAPVNWTSESGWVEGSNARPSVLRVQLIPYIDGASTSFDAGNALDVIEADSRTVFIAPCETPLPSGCVRGLDINTLDSRSTAGNQRPVVLPATTPAVPLTYGACTGGIGNYSCSVTLTGFGAATGAGKTYYARISLVYGQSAEVSLGALSGGTSVAFSNVQPWIDVTGRTNDVFRRVRAQVSHDSGASFPRFAIDSAAPICKDMFTTSDPSTSMLNCTY